MTSWIPACVRCGVPGHGFPAFPGTEDGPRLAGAVGGPWACRACGQANHLGLGAWARAPETPAHRSPPMEAGLVLRPHVAPAWFASGAGRTGTHGRATSGR